MKLVALVVLALSVPVFANCGDSEMYYYHLKNNRIIKQGKGIYTACANMHGGQEYWSFNDIEAVEDLLMEGEPVPKGYTPFTVNDKKASYIEKKIKGKKVGCFVFGRNKSEMLCGRKL